MRSCRRQNKFDKLAVEYMYAVRLLIVCCLYFQLKREKAKVEQERQEQEKRQRQLEKEEAKKRKELEKQEVCVVDILIDPRSSSFVFS